eukprot:gene29221-36234_t
MSKAWAVACLNCVGTSAPAIGSTSPAAASRLCCCSQGVINPARPKTSPKPRNLPRSIPMSKTTEFDPASYLDSEEVIAEYLNLALASGDTDLLLAAIGDVAKARGMAQIARDTGPECRCQTPL